MPLNRAKHMRNITTKLAHLVLVTRMDASRNCLDINKYSEDFFAGFLNLVFDLSLVNLNIAEPNATAIDLVDAEHGVAFQITSTKTSKKINDTIDSFKNNNLYTNYGSLYFYILIEKQDKYSSLHSTDSLFNCDESYIHDYMSIIKLIDGKDPNLIEQISNYVDNEISSFNFAPPRTSELLNYIKTLSQLIDNTPSTDLKKQTMIPFDIDDKIKYNNLVEYQSIVEDYGEYYSICDGAFNCLDDGIFLKKNKILGYVSELYREEKRQLIKQNPNIDIIETIQNNSDTIISNIIKKIVSFIMDKDNNCILSHEDIIFCTPYFVCYAFGECKILERPKLT